MKKNSNDIIAHLFEFWEYMGSQGDFLYEETNYKYTKPYNFSWPCRIFGIDSVALDFDEIHQKMKASVLPNSLAISGNKLAEKELSKYKFELKSIVKGMCLDLSRGGKPIHNFPTIQRVDDEVKAREFAKISTSSFGYEIFPTTIISLIDCKKIKLFLGKHTSKFVSCGMIYLDKNGCSGIHMIGTLPKYRGHGLGKLMTNKLLFEAYENLSERVVLVASEAGEKIYSKLGFIAQGSLKSYSVGQQLG